MNSENENAIAKAHQEVATRNARAAIDKIKETKGELDTRLQLLEMTVTSLQQEQEIMSNRINLLLTKNFTGGSTSE